MTSLINIKNGELEVQFDLNDISYYFFPKDEFGDIIDEYFPENSYDEDNCFLNTYNDINFSTDTHGRFTIKGKVIDKNNHLAIVNKNKISLDDEKECIYTNKVNNYKLVNMLKKRIKINI